MQVWLNLSPSGQCTGHYLAEAVSGAYWPQKGVMAAKEEDIREDIPERIKAQLVLSNI